VGAARRLGRNRRLRVLRAGGSFPTTDWRRSSRNRSWTTMSRSA